MAGMFIQMKSSGLMLECLVPKTWMWTKAGQNQLGQTETCPLLQDESVDLRNIYLSVAALSGSVSFKPLLHCAFNVSPFAWACFHQQSPQSISDAIRPSRRVVCPCVQLFDGGGKGSLGLGELSGLMGALLGFPQHSVAELYAEATNNGRLTEG